jgi:hypothetical protein
MEVSGQLHAPAALPQEKSPCYPLDRRMGGPQSRSGSGGEEKNSQPLSGIETPIIQPAAQSYTTELTWCLNVAAVVHISLVTMSRTDLCQNCQCFQKQNYLLIYSGWSVYL